MLENEYVYGEGQLPNITGRFSSVKQVNANYNMTVADGAFYSRGQDGTATNSIRSSGDSVTAASVCGFSAANVSTLYKNITYVLARWFKAYQLIKY